MAAAILGPAEGAKFGIFDDSSRIEDVKLKYRDSAHEPCSSNNKAKDLGTAFSVSHATATRILKGEDTMFIEEIEIVGRKGTMYMVCDGHSGVEAATFAVEECHRLISLASLQTEPFDSTDIGHLSRHLRRVICQAFISIDKSWSETLHTAGTTATLLLIVDKLITVANIGDSSSVLDTGCSMLEMTHSHRLQENAEEQNRLRAAGCRISQLGFHLQGPAKPGEPGVGPIRVWPGGLCVSRSIGDIDVGSAIVPLPHIKQVIVPGNGCRIIMASDGLWDVVSLSKAVKLTRSKTTGAAAAALIDSVRNDHRFMDDASIIVIDVVPQDWSSFPAAALNIALLQAQMGIAHQAKQGGICGCFSREPEIPDSRKMSQDDPAHLQLLFDIDCLLEFPSLNDDQFDGHDAGAPLRLPIAMRSLAHGSTHQQKQQAPGQKDAPQDYTMHGGNAHFSNNLSPISELGAALSSSLMKTPRPSEQGSIDYGSSADVSVNAANRFKELEIF